MMKNVWIVAPFSDIEDVGGNNRFQYLANRLYQTGSNVTLFTSNFSHMEKKHVSNKIASMYPFQVKCIKESGYKQNVSIKRGLSHLGFSRRFKKVIESMEKPDVIYSAYPTMCTAYVAGKYAKKKKVPFIIDIQDTWPESIASAIDTSKPFVKSIMWPFTKFANKIYKMPDVVFGVSDTYAQRANIKGSACKEFISVYIGTETDKFNQMSEDPSIQKHDDEIWITYIGTLSHSYDIETAIRAFSKMKDQCNIKLNIIGSGPHEEKLISIAKNLEVFGENVNFYGYLPYEKMASILKMSDIALNAIKGNAKQTITNKLGDYVSAGLPILNSCQEKEVLSLIHERKLGLNYMPENPDMLKESILKMIKDKNRMQYFSNNSLNFARARFNREESYRCIIERIQAI